MVRVGSKGRLVFPARAGMSPVNTETVIKMVGFPRPRGDEPITGAPQSSGQTFSPPARG